MSLHQTRKQCGTTSKIAQQTSESRNYLKKIIITPFFSRNVAFKISYYISIEVKSSREKNRLAEAFFFFYYTQKHRTHLIGSEAFFFFVKDAKLKKKVTGQRIHLQQAA